MSLVTLQWKSKKMIAITGSPLKLSFAGAKESGVCVDFKAKLRGTVISCG
jgi:hypothetical protein